MTINKKVLRSAHKKLSFHLVTAFLTMITVAMLIGALTTADTLGKTSSELDETLCVEDAQFITADILTDEEISEYEQRYDLIIEPQIYTDISAGENTIRVFRENRKLNLTYVFEDASGIHESAAVSHINDGDICLCKKYAEANSLNIGDMVSLSDNTVRLSGFALRPDYINTIKDLTETIGDYSHFSIAVVSEKTFESTSGKTNIYYSVKYNDKTRTDDFRKQLYANHRPSEYFNSDANSRISLLRSEVPMLKGEFSSYSIILFALVIVLITFMLARIISSESRNIGTLMALGYRRNELAVHYVLYALLPTVIGGIAGVLISIPFSKAFTAFFFNDFDSFHYGMQIRPVYLLVPIIPLILNAITCIAVTLLLLKKDAVKLIKQEKSAGKVRTLFKGKNIGFRLLYALRVLAGNPLRTVVFVIGMCTASVIILLGGICQDSQRNVVDHVLPDMMGAARYETGMKTFQTGSVENGETLIDVMFEVPDTTAAFNLVGYDEDNRLLKRETVSGTPVEYGKYYMTSAAANCYGISAGGDFTFVHRITGEHFTVTVTDIIDNNALKLLITSKENAARIVGVYPDQYNNILSEVPVNIPDEKVLMIADFDTYMNNFEQLLSATKAVYTILLAVGIIVCVLIVNLLSGMIIDENNRNISMLKVLGYHDREIGNIILSPNHFLLPCCYLLAIPVTAYMAKLMMADSVTNSGIWIDVVIKPQTVVIYFVIVAAAYLVSLVFAKRRLDRVEMTVSLKQED